MRIRSMLPVLAAALLAFPLAAQEHAVPQSASFVQPLPVELAPRAAERGALRSPLADQMELGLVTGVLVGMGVGVVYRSVTYDRHCGRLEEDRCLLSREVETMAFSMIGGSLGGLIGVVSSRFLHPGGRAPVAAPVHVVPAAEGGMTVGVTLRH
jgi:hypothetical protein